MNARTKKLTKIAALDVELGEDKAGRAQPRIVLRFEAGAPYRARRAALLALAADAELASPPSEHWTVESIGGHYDTGHVYLDLMDATDDEAEHGMQVLRRVIA